MSSSTKNWIIIVLILIVLAGVFALGYSRYPVWHGKPETKDSIVYIYDTAKKHIYHIWPWYIESKDSIKYRNQKWIDSILLANKVDTAAILAQYYAFHTYSRAWKDSSLTVTLSDVISENRVFDSDFDYKILRPQEIINTVNYINNYPKYIYLGMQTNAMDIRYTSFSVFRASKRLLIGGGYIPYQKDFALTVAFKIGQMK